MTKLNHYLGGILYMLFIVFGCAVVWMIFAIGVLAFGAGMDLLYDVFG